MKIRRSTSELRKGKDDFSRRRKSKDDFSRRKKCTDGPTCEGRFNSQNKSTVDFSQLTDIYLLRRLKSSLFLFLFFINFLSAQTASIKGIVQNASGKAIKNVSILISDSSIYEETDKDGIFTIAGLELDNYYLTFFAEGYQTTTHEVQITSPKKYDILIKLDDLHYDLETVEVQAEDQKVYGIRRLRNVEGVAIYAAKKSEVIEMNSLLANLATNNARQVYKGIAGLNIWESDGAGLQLSIGARGLDPNRTSNFNTRQNGYDISADALGYPESYYTPPTQALERIEVVRGAASLQYGPQFGGLLNFVFKKGTKGKPLEFLSENTVGSFGLLSSFNSLGGEKNGWNYYAFYQRKQGDGWRENGAFHQNTVFAAVSKKVNDRLTIRGEYTHMNYLAQQAGGLQDFEFEQDPRQSKRARNWFQVQWNLAALTVDYRLSDQTKINSRSFVLHAQREALGELGAINRPDPLRERDLIRGQYDNFGNETRLIHHYKLGKQVGVFLAGVRFYKGFTQSKQGDASDGSTADFEFLNPDDLERSSYEFPSRNIAFFVENLFQINPKWSITPGLRLERIRTASEGFFKERIFSGGELIFEQKFEDSKRNARSFALLGLGTAHQLTTAIETYANFSQNYRSINFSDLALSNPNLVVDSLLQDERGFNMDLGIRGTLAKEAIRFDASLFYLRYQNRIGIAEKVIPDPAVIERAVAFRTNIGDAVIGGIEAYIEADLLRIFSQKATPNSELSVFVNTSYLKGKYTSGTSSIVGNAVELIPPFSLKTGLNYRWGNLKASYQWAFVAAHFSDATNATFVVDATRGMIPTYQVQDLGLQYAFRRFKLQCGVNNLTNRAYFTRRATAYPGPGIISADGRSFYVTLGVRW